MDSRPIGVRGTGIDQWMCTLCICIGDSSVLCNYNYPSYGIYNCNVSIGP